MAKKATSPKIIAHRYAVALYDIASEKKAIKPILKDLTVLAKTLNTLPQAKDALASKKNDQSAKRAVIDEIIKKGKPHKLTANFLKLLVQQDRFSLFDHIVAQLQTVYDDDQDVRHVKAVTATKLNKTQRDDLENNLKKVLSAKKIELNTSTDPSLLGGVLIRFGSTLIDDTLKNKLNRIAKKMKGIA